MTGSATPPNGASDIWWDAAVFVLLVATAALVLAVPAFPTQDGPIHLYYTDVLRAVLTHTGPYSRHFEIKTLLTPYALEYYALLALETVLSPAMSEKLLLCGYVFAFGLGFRYLVKSVAERTSPWTLAGIPFCMHLLVYLGLLNYCFGVALLFFLSAYWLRHAQLLTPRRIAILLGGLMLMLLIHPVPAAVFLLFAGFHIAAVSVRDTSLLGQRRQMVLLAAMAAIAIAWIGLFVDRSPRAPSPPGYFQSMGWADTVAAQLQLLPAMPFTGLRYRIGPIVLLAIVALALGWSLARRSGRANPAVPAMLATGAVCFLLFGLVPLEINGSWNFPERFPILWIAFSIAAAAASRPPRWLGVLTGAAAVLVTVIVLALQWQFVSVMAAGIGTVNEAPSVQAGSVGLIVGRQNGVPRGLAFEPYRWAAASYFRRSGAILANEPWMDLPIVMLKPVDPDRFSYLDPPESRRQLEEMALGGEAPPALDFVVQNRPFDEGMELVLKRFGFANASGDEGLVRIFRRPGN